MSTTRSSARLAALATTAKIPSAGGVVKASRKRKAETTLTKENTKKLSMPKIHGIVSQTSPQENAQAISSQVPEMPDEDEETNMIPAVLTFNYEEAKKHLIEVDHRFEDLFNKVECKPFEQLEQVHPFRALATSILAQQISWLAARSIIHKFIRLYDPSLPEKPTDEERKSITFFPTARQVATTDLEVLRTAGLSARKAEYIHDLAARFADGRLSTKGLLQANDEELAEMLIQVRGIGSWTVDMFAIFSLRRPDILPVGDLGVQRGVLRWFLSLHSPTHSFGISPEKVGGSRETKVDELPSLSDGENHASSIPPGVSRQTEGLPEVPPSFTPSIKMTLEGPAVDAGKAPVPLPEGIDIAMLKSRLNGKKKIRGSFLTPGEMTSLTESWKPYRSIGVFYMWSLDSDS